MNTLATLSTTFQTYYHYVQPAVLHAINHFPLSQKVFDFTLKHFSLFQNSFVCACGIKELAFDRVKYHRAAVLALQPNKRWSLQAYDVLKSSHKTDREFYEVHGVIFAGSGLMGVMAILYEIKVLHAISSGLFTLSNFIALKYHVTIFRSSMDEKVRFSAALGIASNLGYIFSYAVLITGCSTTLALIFSGIAILSGGAQIIYEAVLYLSKWYESKYPKQIIYTD